MFWTMKKAGYRAVQVGLGLAMRVIPWQKPVLVEHPGAIGALPAALAEDGLHKVLVVTDRGVLRAGLVNRIYKELERAGVAVEVFSDVHANPTIPDILGCTTLEMNDTAKARAFIKEVYALRRSLGLAESLPALDATQLETVCRRALREANPLYPVPRIMNLAQCRSFVKMLMK